MRAFTNVYTDLLPQRRKGPKQNRQGTSSPAKRQRTEPGLALRLCAFAGVYLEAKCAFSP